MLKIIKKAERKEFCLRVVIPAKAGIYEMKMGGKERILFDFFRLCFIQSMRTFSAVKLVPPLE
jgi:hypothetical protein